ncbi:quinone oxidoreductase 2 homolog [Olea europaea subsp. europaea]|uniref:Quinone oxidoreductase 2 homolog n=1 Tax=Olea europaea subsp. europaea TaxID=158383 RepID=A0A8S0Q3N2_OLEEU|nr:quinone oxidoreductase 2 homolog [Olea europaea subsp. europaea]
MVFLCWARPSPHEQKTCIDKSGDFNYDSKYRGSTVKPADSVQQDRELSDSGFSVNHSRVLVGSGCETFEKGKSALQNWRHFGLNWAFVDPRTPIHTGVKFCVCVKELFPWLMMPLQVVYVNENRSPKKAVASFGFGSGTLSGHLLAGEERFSITLDENNKAHPIPQLNSPTAGRVRVKANSLNFANYLQILGKYQEKPPLPFIPGSDYSGTVESVGSNVTKFKIATPFAPLLASDHSPNSLLPTKLNYGCDMVAVGALPVAYGTSHVALLHRAQLRAGPVLLVLGAAGGVGVSAVQIGKICGAIVIAVARGEEKVKYLKSLGVDHVVDSSTGNIIDSIKGFLKARKLKGVDVLYDPVGGKLTKESMKLLKWRAHILIME